MREKRVDARRGLLRILGVYFIFHLSIVFRNGEDAQALDGFERVCRFWVLRANMNR